MRNRKALIIGLAALFAAGLMTSCSQEETQEQASKQVTRQKTTVKELTEQLRAYNASITTRSEAATEIRRAKSQPNKFLSVAIADVKGAIRGWRIAGGKGAVVGAAVCSLFQVLKEKFFLTSTMKPPYPTVFTGNITAFEDSIGYYHNSVEMVLYQAGTGLNSPSKLVDRANKYMRYCSTGYAADGGLDSTKITHITVNVGRFKQAARADVPFDDYCNTLKRLNPEDSDYIDFAAEYLTVAFYANLNVDEYTQEVLFMIDNANTDIDDAMLLRAGILVAHASYVFSTNLSN